MATRDRTGLFLSYRGSFPHRRGTAAESLAAESRDTEALMARPSHETVIEMDMLPPQWADTREQIEQILGNAHTLSQRLEKLYSRHALPGFDFESKRMEEVQIEDMTAEVTQAFRECQQLIKNVGRGKGSEVEMKMAHNMQIALAQRVQEESTAFRRKQSRYLKKLQGYASSAGINPESTGSADDAEDDIALSQTTIKRQAQAREAVTANEEVITVREREIQNIAKGILDLADIFKDLQTMVIDQGTLLDRIDYNIETTATYVKDADVQLNKASDYQKRTRKRKIMLLLVLIIIGLIIVLIFKPRTSRRVVVVEDPDKVSGDNDATSGNDGGGAAVDDPDYDYRVIL